MIQNPINDVETKVRVTDFHEQREELGSDMIQTQGYGPRALR